MEIITSGNYPGKSLWWIQQYIERKSIVDAGTIKALREFFFDMRSAGLDKKLTFASFGVAGLNGNDNLLNTSGAYLPLSAARPSVNLHLLMHDGAEDYSGNNSRGWTGGEYPNNAFDFGSPFGSNPTIRLVGDGGVAYTFGGGETQFLSFVYNDADATLYGVVDGALVATVPVTAKPKYVNPTGIGYSNGYANTPGGVKFTAAGYEGFTPEDAIQLQKIALTALEALV